MGCDTCKSECGREDGCGTRKATQKVVLDGLAERLYPSRTWGQADDEACFRAGLSLSEVQRLGRQVAAVNKAPVFFVPGGEQDLCSFLYVLCLGREPSLCELRAGSVSAREAGFVTADGELVPEAALIRERYLRIACSTVTRAICIQEVAMELELSPDLCPPGMALIKELVQPGVFDPKLLKRFQRTVDLAMAQDIEHLDMGLLDVDAAQLDLLPGDYEAQFGTTPALLNFFFYAQPVLTASVAFVPLAPVAQRAVLKATQAARSTDYADYATLQ